MDSKKVIEKLVKIAENQQKIINKLAQQAGMVPPGAGGAQPMGGVTDDWDLKATIAEMLSKIPSAAKARAGVKSATMGKQSGYLDVWLQFPSVKSMEDPNANETIKQLRAALKSGSTIKAPDGSSATVGQSSVQAAYA